MWRTEQSGQRELHEPVRGREMASVFQKLEGCPGGLGCSWKGVWKLNLSRQGLRDELSSVS